MAESFKKVLIVVLFFALCSQVVSARNREEIFNEAQTAFNQGLEQKGESKRLLMLRSANLFTQLIKEQEIENGYLYYNIGNAYYEAGEKGKAILNYRRAERFIPSYQDLKYNLTKVRGEIGLSQARDSWWRGLVKNLFFFHYLIDLNMRGIFFLLFFILFWFMLTVSIFYRNSFTVFLQGSFLVAFFCLGISVAFSAYHLQRQDTGVVTKLSTIPRKGPGNSYQPAFKQPLPGGTEFELLKREGDWWRVRLYNGEELWVQKSSSQLI
jgi:tetratricopeptide (TPR) repeat protein